MNAPLLNSREALVSLRTAWRRNLMSLAGLVIGVGAIVAMLALALIVRHEALRRFDRTSLDTLAIRQVSGSGPQVARRPPAISLDLALGLAAQPGFELSAPVLLKKAPVTFSGRQFDTTCLGVTADFFALNDLPLAAGRALSDLDRYAAFAVIGHARAQSFLNNNPLPLLGRQITVDGRVLTIIGVLEPAASIPFLDGEPDHMILMPATTFSRVLDDRIAVVMARHRAGVDTADAVDTATRYFQQRVDGLTVQITSAAEIVREMERQLRLFALFFGAAGSIALVLGGAGIMNSLLLAVSERRREIGLRRALGALRADIQSQFLQEAAMLCGIGGLLGVGLGSLVTWVIAYNAGWPFMMPVSTLLLGGGVALAVGAIAGFLPARQAARLDPVLAIRSER